LRRSLERLGVVGFGAVGLGLGMCVLAASSAWASNLPSGGAASLVNASTSAALATNTFMSSSVLFNLVLPSGAVCTDSGGLGGSYVTFLVPASTNLAALTDTDNSTADGAGVVDQGVALANAQGWVPFEPADNAPAGGIDTANTSDFEMGYEISPVGLVVSGTQIPLPNNALIQSPGTTAQYEAGLACFNNNTNTETDFWAVPVTFEVNAGDPGGNGFEWEIPASSSPQLAESPLAVGLPVGGSAVLLGAVFINRRRRRARPAAI
jgi:hypothetical protein